MGPRIGSLCSGYGGLDLGVQAVLGGTVAWHVEYDKDPSRILAHRWPDVPNFGDLTTIDWTRVPPVDALIGGIPCQPFSAAGKRAATGDPRHLWPYMADAVRVLRPRVIIVENVPGFITRGGLDSVLCDLAAMRYDARWLSVRASDAGAPHRRERVFLLATDPVGERRNRRGGQEAAPGSADPAAHTTVAGLQGSDDGNAETPTGGHGQRAAGHWGAYAPAIARWEAVTGRPAPAPTEPGRNDRPRLSPRFVEWLMGLEPGHVTGVPGLSRNAQLKALGNGVVPQQAALALRLLLTHPYPMEVAA